MSTVLPWIPAVAAFLGAGLAYLGARSGTRQREDQGRREEWGRRFTAALDQVASPEERQQVLGSALLGELAGSELATGEERDLARTLLEHAARFDTTTDPVDDPPPSGDTDSTEARSGDEGDAT